MKRFFYFMYGFILAALITNTYSFFHRDFFRSAFSIFINLATPAIVLIYLVKVIIRKKKLKKKVHDQQQKFFSKN